MSHIRILSEHLANQIAAGEVIERPASVVKEFLENSIDAGAQRIAIQVEGDGTRLIRIVDDGCGMDSDDALLCLERHATSKLDSNDGNQLSAILTLGFRGEAIPSIASVAQMTITSRPESSSLGTRIEIRYGKINKVHETGATKGTVMEVRNLFGNQPARKKFLKTSRTELYHIEEAVRSYALANPHISFSYSVNNSILFDFDNHNPSLFKRFKSVYNRTAAQDIVLLDYPSATDSSEPTINGFLLPPDEVGISGKLRTFVNNRSVRDRLINHAVMEGLSGFMMKGRRPAGAIFITIDPSAVDVNVHPAKQEIRFRKSQIIHQLVSLTTRQAMQDFQENLKSHLFSIPAESEHKHPVKTDNEPRNTVYQPEMDNTPLPFDMLPRIKPSLSSSIAEPPPVSMKKTVIPGATIAESFTDPLLPVDSPEKFNQQKSSDEVVQPQTLRPLGQIADLYILCEAAGKLLIIDQHAAHERLIFETLKNQFFSKKITRQSLMFPQILEVESTQVQILETHQETIRNLGIDIEDFGAGSWVIKAVPAILAKYEPTEILAGILEQLAGHTLSTAPSGRKAAVQVEDVLSSMACKAAIKSGCRMNMAEINSLLNDMINADIFSHCPHGRPVAKTFSLDEIKKWFHRT